MKPSWRSPECRTDGRIVARRVYRFLEVGGALKDFLWVWDVDAKKWTPVSKSREWWDAAKVCSNPEEAPTC